MTNGVSVYPHEDRVYFGTYGEPAYVQVVAGDNIYFYENQSAVFALELEGDLLYAAHASSGLVIYDVTDTTQPRVIGDLPASGGIEALDLAGNQAYLACGK